MRNQFRAFTYIAWIILCVGGMATADEPCRIRVVDAKNGWPVSMVELVTVHGVRFVSDNNGWIAFDLPELMDTETWFTINGHGYEVPADGFGYRGVRLTPVVGTTLTVELDRTMPAQRLGRLTGAGLFAESQQLGLETDWREQRILGCDTVQTAVHRGEQFWLWGDTNLASYPLGRFHTIGATTDPRGLPPLEPPLKLRYRYFTDESGMPRNVAEMPGDGPTWCDGMASLPDRDGQFHLVATYRKIHPPLEEYERGLCIWDDQQNQFQRHSVIWEKSPHQPDAPATPYGHPVRWMDDESVEWLLFGDPWPTIRCRPTMQEWENPSRWQSIESPKYATSREGNEQILPHRGSIAWSGYRNRWITIFTRLGGKSSYLGEIWYAESDSPLGPWTDAVQVANHDNYTFYNPMIHPQSTTVDSPTILFEGTYTDSFSKADHVTPRYDYNQILYRLDLDQLVLANDPSMNSIRRQ